VGDGRGAVAGLCQAVAAGISRRGGGKGGLVPDRRASAGVEELQAQIRRDAELARQIYNSPEKEGG